MLNPNSLQTDEVSPAEAAKPAFKVDLACGGSKAEGFFGVDVAALPGVDLAWDLTKEPWPIKDDSVDEARCSHFFEHLHPRERVIFMNELWRILKKGAGCLFVTPRGFDRQVQDFNHCWPPIVESSYNYFDQEWLKANKLDHYNALYGITCDFEVRPMQVSVTPEFALKSEDVRLFAARNYTNAAIDLVVVMVKR